MRIKITLSFFLFFYCFIAIATNYPESILNKKYSVQCHVLDSIQSEFFNKDFDSLKGAEEFKNIEQWASDKGDIQLKYLCRYFQYHYEYVRKEIKKDIEGNLIQLIKELGETKFNLVQADAYELLANYYWTSKNYAPALENYIYAYSIYSEFSYNDFPHKVECLAEFGGKYYYFRDFATAKKYFLEIDQMLPESDRQKHISQLNTLALCYSNLQEYDSAIYYFHKVELVALNSKSEAWVGIISGNLGNIYYMKKKYDEALPMLEKNVELSLKNGVILDAALSYSSIGQIYLLKQDYKKALEYQLKAYDLIKKKNAFNGLVPRTRIYPFLAKAYAANGKMDLAYAFLDTASDAKDTLENQHNIVFVSGVQHKIDVEKHKADLQKTEAELNHQKLFKNSLIVGFLILLLSTSLFFYQKRRISKEKKRSDELLLNILPIEVADEIKATGTAKAKNYTLVTVMFTDFKDFTNIGEKMSPEQLVSEIHLCFSAFDNIIQKHGVEKIKTIGDAYMCAGGIPIKNESHPEDVVKAAIEIRDFMEKHKKEKLAKGETPFEIRIGINTGPVVAGIVGVKKFAYDIWGDTVNLAARMEESGEVGKINISGSTCNLVKYKYNCTYRGKVLAKNKGEVDMYFVEPKA